MKPRALILIPLFAASIAACSYDPVPASIIDGLGEEKGTPDENHRPGQPCLACHSAYGGAEPRFAVAGTLFSLSPDQSSLVPAPNILVTLLDSAGQPRKSCSNQGGNFMVLADNWEDITFPLGVEVPAAGRPMVSLIGRDGSCGSCHKLPDDDSFDPILGTAHDSVGVILVDPTVTDAMCGGGS
jgi:hypothetical protein